MPRRFSCTTPFKRSYFLNTRMNMGCTLLIIRYSPTASTGSAQTKIRDSCAFMEKDITMANISIMGHLTAILVII